jgi:hypothetical protein
MAKKKYPKPSQVMPDATAVSGPKITNADAPLNPISKGLDKAPGGGPAKGRPLVPGGIQGGSPLITSSIPGATPTGPTGEVFTKSDPARDLWRFYKTGVDRPLNMPAEPTDLETIEEKKVKPTGPKGYKKTEARLATAEGIRGGTIGGMSRAPGSKPAVTQPFIVVSDGKFISSMGIPMAIEIAAERARRQETLEILQEAIRESFVIERGEGKVTSYANDPYSPGKGLITRAEEAVIMQAAREARDIIDNMEATVKEYALQEEIKSRQLTGQVDPRAESAMQSETYSRLEEGTESMLSKVDKQAAAERKTLEQEVKEKVRIYEESKKGTPLASDYVQPSEKITIHSGGAVGADTEWANIGKRIKADVIAHSFLGHKISGGIPYIHSQVELNRADILLEKINKDYLPNRRFSTAKEYVKNLLRRNYFQIVDSDALIAAGKVEDVPNVGKRVSGGTAWAFYMAVEQGKPAYIFNQTDGQWYFGQGKELVRVNPESIPRYKTIAGVGTRDLNDAGRKALNNYVNNVVSKPSVVAKPTTVTVDGMRMPIISPRGILGLGVVGFAVDVLQLWRQFEAEIKQQVPKSVII